MRVSERGSSKLTMVLMLGVVAAAGLKFAGSKGVLKLPSLPAAGKKAPPPEAEAAPVLFAPTPEETCREVLAEVGRAVERYETKHGKLPERLPGEAFADPVIARLEKEGLFRRPPAIARSGRLCPRAVDPAALAAGVGGSAAAGVTPGYRGFEPIRPGALPGAAPLVWDLFEAQHDPPGRNVLFRDGRVQFLPEDVFRRVAAAALVQAPER